LNFLASHLRLEGIRVSGVRIKLGILVFETCIVKYNTEALRVGCAICRPYTILTQTVVTNVYCATLSGLLRRRFSVIESGLSAYTLSSFSLEPIFPPLAS
jgi:uncharacterized RDD family membrane protein YckC